MEYAVIKTGGKQYIVKKGDTLKIEKIKGDFSVGSPIVFDEVFLLDNGNLSIGNPTVSGAKVKATLKEIGRDKTVTVIKYKQKSRYFKKNGHRQPWFKVMIDSLA